VLCIIRDVIIVSREPLVGFGKLFWLCLTDKRVYVKTAELLAMNFPVLVKELGKNDVLTR
jgi:hypothetical protein